MVTPYVGSIQEKVIKNFSLEKFEYISERHFDLTDNFSLVEVSEYDIVTAYGDVINEGAEAVVILCTNLSGAGIALIVERKFGVSVLHSVFETVWGAFNAIGSLRR